MAKPQLTANTVRNAETAIAALKQKRPKSVAEARQKSIELIRLGQVLDDASKQKVVANVVNASSGKAAGGPAYVTVGYFDKSWENLQIAFDEGFKLAKAYIDHEIGDLKTEIAELKARPSMKYEGVWDLAKIYQVGDCITSDGSMWICTESNINTEPPASCWKLCVKRGRDGRDRR